MGQISAPYVSIIWVLCPKFEKGVFKFSNMQVYAKLKNMSINATNKYQTVEKQKY